jgi:hypothetical protein
MLAWYLSDVISVEFEPGIQANVPVVEHEYTGINTGGTVYHATLPLCLVLVGAAEATHAVFATDERVRQIAEHDNPGTPLSEVERLGLNAMFEELTLPVTVNEGDNRRDVIEAIGQTMDANFDPSVANVPDIE